MQPGGTPHTNYMYIRDINGILSVLVFATMDGKSVYGSIILSKNVECGATTNIGASLVTAFLPFTVIQ